MARVLVSEYAASSREMCGVMAGRSTGAGDVAVTHVCALDNLANDSNSFVMSSAAVRHVRDRFRRMGLPYQILVHSHPRPPLTPTWRDIEALKLLGLAGLIYRVEGGRLLARAYRVRRLPGLDLPIELRVRLSPDRRKRALPRVAQQGPRARR